MYLLLIAILIFLLLIIIYSYIFFIRILKLLKFSLKKDWWKLLLFIVALTIIIYLFNVTSIIFVLFIHLLIYTVITDIIFKIATKFIKSNKLSTFNKYLIIPLLLTIFTFIYGYINFYNIIETKYNISTSKNIQENLRILYISDSHYGNIFKKTNLNNIKKDLNKVNADIILLGGDIVDDNTTKSDMEYIFKILGSIKNKKGIYYVYGNHDRQLYSLNKLYTEEDLNNTLTKNNITLLKDQHITLDNITIIGRDDLSNERASLEELTKKINKDNYLIMLDHQPVEYKDNVNSNIDLIISGHTHAGQIFPAEYVINIFNTSDFAYGHKKMKNTNAIVSSGLSGWGFPLRTSRHSEYVVINICKK